ncbi:MAG: hypothetical protein JJ714_03945 [Acidithiobacillus sp.]|nr:hypothetical protein [Acidithiobacillus sp.]
MEILPGGLLGASLALPGRPRDSPPCRRALHYASNGQGEGVAMLSFWGEIIIMIGTPVLLLVVALGVNRLARRHHSRDSKEQ